MTKKQHLKTSVSLCFQFLVSFFAFISVSICTILSFECVNPLQRNMELKGLSLSRSSLVSFSRARYEAKKLNYLTTSCCCFALTNIIMLTSLCTSTCIDSNRCSTQHSYLNILALVELSRRFSIRLENTIISHHFCFHCSRFYNIIYMFLLFNSIYSYFSLLSRIYLNLLYIQRCLESDS